jgi:hypothetical protein
MEATTSRKWLLQPHFLHDMAGDRSSTGFPMFGHKRTIVLHVHVHVHVYNMYIHVYIMYIVYMYMYTVQLPSSSYYQGHKCRAMQYNAMPGYGPSQLSVSCCAGLGLDFKVRERSLEVSGCLFKHKIGRFSTWPLPLSSSLPSRVQYWLLYNIRLNLTIFDCQIA